MRRGLPIALLMLCLASPRGTWADDAGPGASPSGPAPVLDQKLTVGDITISYPTGLEPQAQQVADICRAVMIPRLETLRAMDSAFPDGERTATVLTRMLGRPEDQEAVAQGLSAVGQSMSAIAGSILTDVRVYRESDLKAAGRISEGAVTLTYLPETDKFDFRVETHMSASEVGRADLPLDRGFYPVIVRSDGTFRCQQDLSADMADISESLVTLMAAQGRWATAMTMVGGLLVLRSQEPFTRWFIEGMTYWVTPRVMAEIAPEYAEQYREMLQPQAPPPQARARVNLLAWPLDEDPRPRDAPDEASAYCAYELMERLLRDRPDGTLAAIMDELEKQEPFDTEAILRAFDAVLGGDSRSLLLEYAPEAVRTGLQEGRPEKLRDEGYQALRDGDCSKAVRPLADALEMTPSDADMRVNLAVAMRRSGIPKQGSERQIRLAAALARGQPDREFALVGEADDETWYVLGRIAQLEENTEKARELLGKLPPDHADGRAALDEIEKQAAPVSDAQTE